MKRTTRGMLEISFNTFLRELYADNGDCDEMSCWELSMWSPGDRYGTRYRVELDGQTPLGSRYWVGASAAYEGLWTAIYTIRLMRGE